MASSRKEIKKLINEQREEILSKENVVGMAVGPKVTDGQEVAGGYSLVVFVEKKKPLEDLDDKDVVPVTVNGHRTDVVETGFFKKLSTTDRQRPLVPGISAGHKNISAGTLGCVVYDKESGDPYFLSNNHVFADSNSGREGDRIIQPGAHDGGGVANDTIATLDRYVPIVFPGESPPGESGDCPVASTLANVLNFISRSTGHKTVLQPALSDGDNLMDAALAKPLADVSYEEEIPGIGTPIGVHEADIGDTVRKRGRTTGVTTGTVVYLDADIEVGFGSRGNARFTDQIVTTYMSEPGDSGSLVVYNDGANIRACGLLFAGSSQYTIMNRIDHVLDSLGVTF